MRRVALVLIILGTVLWTGVARAQGETLVTVVPATVSLDPGAVTVVEVWVQNVVRLYGVDIRMQFDPAIVSVVDANPADATIQVQRGEFLEPGPVFEARNEASNVDGTITYAASLWNPAVPATGGGVLLRITFRGVSAGSSPLVFTRCLLVNDEPATISVVTVGGTLVVTGPTRTPTASPTRTVTSTPSPTQTATRTSTVAPTETLVPTTTATPSATAGASSTATRTATPSATGSPMASPTGTATLSATPTSTSTATVVPSLTASPTPSPTSTVPAIPVERVVLEEVARLLGWPIEVAQEGYRFVIRYTPLVGHDATAWIQRFDAPDQAANAWSQNRDGLNASGWSVEPRDLNGWSAYRASRAQEVAALPVTETERRYEFHASLWLAGAGARDEGPYNVAPDPETVSEVIYQVGYERGLFQELAPRAFLPLVLSSRATPPPTPTPTPTLTPTPGLTPVQLVVNPGFETDEAWDLPHTSYPAAYSSAFKRSGERSMRLGIDTGYNVFSYSSAQQTVDLPDGLSSAMLTYHYLPITAALPGDSVYFYVFRSADMMELYSSIWNETQVGWKQKTIDLLPFAGQQVTLRFGVKNDGLDGVTAVYLDDVELWAARSP